MLSREHSGVSDDGRLNWSPKKMNQEGSPGTLARRMGGHIEKCHLWHNEVWEMGAFLIIKPCVFIKSSVNSCVLVSSCFWLSFWFFSWIVLLWFQFFCSGIVPKVRNIPVGCDLLRAKKPSSNGNRDPNCIVPNTWLCLNKELWWQCEDASCAALGF